MNISNQLYQISKYRFISHILTQGTFASQYDLRTTLDEVDSLVDKFKDKDEKEMVGLIIDDSAKELMTVLNSKLIIPGFTFGIKVNDIDTKVYGGYRNNERDKIESNTMFDIASITKLFTQIIAYNLINEGTIKFDDRIKQLDPKFINLEDLSIEDITTFSVALKTPGRIDSKPTIEEARECLYNTSIVSKGEHKYIDIGFMVLKEVFETVTGLTFQELLDKYIISKLDLKNTKINVSEMLKNKLTGSPNMDKLRVNDSSANALGGFSGHAGLWSSSDDLIALGQGMFEGIVPETLLHDFYLTSKYDIRRGKAGNMFVPTDTLFYCVPKIASKQALSVIGSTRTQLNVEQWKGYLNSSTILFNTAILDEETMIREQSRINERRRRSLESPINIHKHTVNEGVEYTTNDVRELLPIIDSTAEAARINSKTTLKLMFLDSLVREYQREANMNMKIETDISSMLK